MAKITQQSANRPHTNGLFRLNLLKINNSSEYKKYCSLVLYVTLLFFKFRKQQKKLSKYGHNVLKYENNLRTKYLEITILS